MPPLTKAEVALLEIFEFIVKRLLKNHFSVGYLQMKIAEIDRDKK